MNEAARKGVRAVRVLDSIVTPKLQSDPALLQVWKTTIRIERPPKRKKEDGQQPAQPLANAANQPAAQAALAGVEPQVNGATNRTLAVA